MKIALFDPYGLKFTDGMMKWWEENGYEVKYSRYFDPQVALWADILWFDTCDNNIASGTNPGGAILDDANNFQPWDLHDPAFADKRIICRPIDIEVWQGHQNAAKWDIVDDVIFIAPHIRAIAGEAMFYEQNSNINIHTIPCAVDLDKFEFAERSPGYDIAVISERWISKGTDLILQIAAKLKKIDSRYRIHWLGQKSGDTWDQDYFEDFISHNDLPIVITNYCESVEEFLEDKSYLLHGSHKEAFSYATAEAMAKGIKPVLHRFYGADDLWPGMTWSTIDEAVAAITDHNYDSASYRQYLIDQGYTLPQMMERIDKVIKGEN